MKYYPTFRWAILQKEVSPYVLLSRPPLPFHLAAEKTSDLHISGTQPTFILSQDQTLKKTPTKITMFCTGDPNPIIKRLNKKLKLAKKNK
jgi:hypothetical protein